LGDGLEAWRGYFASVRPVWKTLMVNVNVCMSAFIEQKTMAQAIADFQRGSRGAVPHVAAMFGKSNLKVRTKHLGYRKSVWAISGQNANEYKFLCEELGGTVTVAEYFRKSKPVRSI
jgi:eukaryotic translation initiation factor 2C